MNKLFLIKSVAFLFCILSFQACFRNGQKRNIRAYYFPLDSFMDGKVYEYRPVNDSLAPFYWYFRTSVYSGDTILTSEYFDHNFEVQQLTNEELVKNGVVLNDFFLYEKDTLDNRQVPVSVRVEVDNVFPFEVTDSKGLFLYKVSWRDYYNPALKYRLIRNKHFLGDTIYTFKGKEVEGIRFFNRELLEVEEKGFQEIAYQGYEIYAKKIGLVYFKKEIGSDIVQEYKLSDIYEMNDLEERFRRYLEQIN